MLKVSYFVKIIIKTIVKNKGTGGGGHRLFEQCYNKLQNWYIGASLTEDAVVAQFLAG